jgi:hypothetical protein
MSELCRWLHEELETLSLVKYPFDLAILPDNGIYFFYEKGEYWGHGGSKSRIVRIGTHKDGNFKNRISEHFLLNDRKMEFDEESASPKDRASSGRILEERC